ncbi:SMC-Scp complex subunit ScpB [Gordonia sp. (in: high G+C Gram-positive bacteria)]|uniref:SMC-Scp complex subunit ScpB n=1 Tax=Gordonia sp. (in: high G+C Gram-positive bacteria) TaxID=84139 RepID=UPI003C75137F
MTDDAALGEDSPVEVGDIESGPAEASEIESNELEPDELDHLDDDELKAALEAVLLVVDTPATVEELASAIEEKPARIRKMLRQMSAQLTEARSGIDLRFAGDGWRFYTRNDYAPYVEKLLLDGTRSKLTRAALETLAVVAYRQPVTRARVSAIRGVNVDGVVRTLLARGLISEAGTDENTTGTLYVTTELFLERLGLASLSELPDIAPLLPGVDSIDDIGDEVLDDPRFAKLGNNQAESSVDVSAQALAEADEA